MSTKDKDEPFAPGDENASTLPLPPPTRVSSSDVPSSAPAPRASKLGEGGEGSGARRGKSEARAGFFERTGEFIRDTRAEMRRVSWPSATQVKNTTIITILAVIFFAIYLYMVDTVFTLLIAQIERLVGWLLGLAS